MKLIRELYTAFIEWLAIDIIAEHVAKDRARRTEQTREDVARRTIDALRKFNEKLLSGEPIDCTVLTTEQTPDGPLTTSHASTLEEWMTEGDEDGNDEEWLDEPDAEGFWWVTHAVKDLPPIIVSVSDSCDSRGMLMWRDTQKCHGLVCDIYPRKWKQIPQEQPPFEGAQQQ